MRYFIPLPPKTASYCVTGAFAMSSFVERDMEIALPEGAEKVQVAVLAVVDGTLETRRSRFPSYRKGSPATCYDKENRENHLPRQNPFQSGEVAKWQGIWVLPFHFLRA